MPSARGFIMRLAIGVASIAPAPAWAQASNAPAPQRRSSRLDPHEEFLLRLEPVDQTVEDTGVLSTSLRHQISGLRHPAGFTSVYRVPGRDDLLMRADGGLYAVFPQSIYLNQKAGLTAVMPPNTVFHMGRASLAGLAAPRIDDLESRVQAVEPNVDVAKEPEWIGTRLVGAGNREAAASTMAEHRNAAASEPTIASSAAYRRHRLRELLQLAAANDGGT